MPTEYNRRYTAKVAELRKTEPRIDWSEVVDSEQKHAGAARVFDIDDRLNRLSDLGNQLETYLELPDPSRLDHRLATFFGPDLGEVTKKASRECLASTNGATVQITRLAWFPLGRSADFSYVDTCFHLISALRRYVRGRLPCRRSACRPGSFGVVPASLSRR
jgi:hypothetical protein